jgi:flagellar basal body-associated protein FliL
MFNLEHSVVEWRKQMLAAGIETPVPLEELEIHLREEIERQMKSGLDEQNTFEISIQQIGQPKALKTEFSKNERKQMKRVLIISAGVVGVLVGMAFVMPAIAQYKHEGTMTLNEICLLLLGLGFTLGGGSVAVFTFKKRKA